MRLRAHRLLRELVPREQYLELTREVLKDPIPGHVVRAIRILAFGGHCPAVSELTALLHDGRNPVARAALEGLLVMGDTARPVLRAEGVTWQWPCPADASPSVWVGSHSYSSLNKEKLRCACVCQ